MILTNEKVTFLATPPRKGFTLKFILDAALEGLNNKISGVDKQCTIEIIRKNKDGSDLNEQLAKLVDAIKSSKEGKTLGVLSRDKAGGSLAVEFSKVLNESGLEMADITSAISSILAVKDEDEIVQIYLTT